MNQQDKQEMNHETGLTDLEPKADVTGGGTTWTGSLTLGSNSTIGATHSSRESNLTYSGESGGLNE